MMRFVFLSLILPLLLGGCSSDPIAPTVEADTLVVQPATQWLYGAKPRYALAEQLQYAADGATGWLDPVQQAVNQGLTNRGWQSVPLAEADLWVAIAVTANGEDSNRQIFARLGIKQVPRWADNPKGSLAIMLIDRQRQQPVWSSRIQLASDLAIGEASQRQLSQQLANQMLGALPAP